MPQGQGYWYNPENNVAIEVTRHEIDIKKPDIQKKLDIFGSVADTLKELPLDPKNEDKIKMLAARSGLVRARDWQRFTTIQFYGKSNKAKDTLFSLAELITAFKNKSHKKLPQDTGDFAKLLATSWQLKINNLATGETDNVSPDEFLEKYAKEGYMENKEYIREAQNRSIRDIPNSPELMEEVEDMLRKNGFFREEEMDSLFSNIPSNKPKLGQGEYQIYLIDMLENDFILNEADSLERTKVIELIENEEWEKDAKSFHDSLNKSKHQKNADRL